MSLSDNLWATEQAIVRFLDPSNRVFPEDRKALEELLFQVRQVRERLDTPPTKADLLKAAMLWPELKLPESFFESEQEASE